MSDIKISAIMPVYNVEKYVGKCIESLLAQTMPDFELIAVDDGSPDNSGKICDEYAKKDSRVKVIHKENGGAPDARNRAIEVARGEYFYFVDSDDWAEPTMFEEMYKTAKEHDAQLVVAGFISTPITRTPNIIPRSRLSPPRCFLPSRSLGSKPTGCLTKTCCTPPGTSCFWPRIS